MRLDRRVPPRPQIPATPLASLALLVFTSVMVSGMYAATRGPGMRFAGAPAAGFDARGAVRVEVDAGSHVAVDGDPVAQGALGAVMTERLAGRHDGAVILVVSPEASYQAMIDAYGAIAGAPGPPRIALSSRARRGAL